MSVATRIILALSTIALGACGRSTSSSVAFLTPTIYFKPTLSQADSACEEADKKPLLSSTDGSSLVVLCPKDFATCLLQGSCIVDDGESLTSYNYHSSKNGEPRFFKVDVDECPFGYGVSNICLDPYFSVAADLELYRAGEVIFIPKLVGVSLPNGEIHDGFLVIRDSGGGIKGAGRFDFFTGFVSHRDQTNPLAKLGFGDPKKAFEYRRATATETEAVLAHRKFPKLSEKILAEGLQKFENSEK